MIVTVGQSFPLYWGYLLGLVLALVPIATTTWVRQHWRWALMSALAIVPLFVIAADYARLTCTFHAHLARKRLAVRRAWRWLRSSEESRAAGAVGAGAGSGTGCCPIR